MEGSLANKLHALITEHGISDVLLLVLGTTVDGNVNSPCIKHGDGGVLVVTCGEVEVSVRPGKDATVIHRKMEMSPTDAGDVIRGLMVATCLAARERANDGPCVQSSGRGIAS
jgi:hypothetical protein